MKREDVYKLIDKERDYQDERWAPEGRVLSDTQASVAAWILYVEYHLNIAKEKVYFLSEPAALEQIRKVTALGVACMEHNETPAR